MNFYLHAVNPISQPSLCHKPNFPVDNFSKETSLKKIGFINSRDSRLWCIQSRFNCSTPSICGIHVEYKFANYTTSLPFNVKIKTTLP